MTLRAIHVQGWRCFANGVEVGPFSDGLNVLHAPNATGKSTLFEALLRGLLDGHRVRGREVEALRPWGGARTPEPPWEPRLLDPAVVRWNSGLRRPMAGCLPREESSGAARTPRH